MEARGAGVDRAGSLERLAASSLWEGCDCSVDTACKNAAASGGDIPRSPCAPEGLEVGECDEAAHNQPEGLRAVRSLAALTIRQSTGKRLNGANPRSPQDTQSLAGHRAREGGVTRSC
jgi:hypothetical protein